MVLTRIVVICAFRLVPCKTLLVHKELNFSIFASEYNRLANEKSQNAFNTGYEWDSKKDKLPIVSAVYHFKGVDMARAMKTALSFDSLVCSRIWYSSSNPFMWFRAPLVIALDVCKTFVWAFVVASFLLPSFLALFRNSRKDKDVKIFQLSSFSQSIAFLFVLIHLRRPVFFISNFILCWFGAFQVCCWLLMHPIGRVHCGGVHLPYFAWWLSCCFAWSGFNTWKYACRPCSQNRNRRRKGPLTTPPQE